MRDIEDGARVARQQLAEWGAPELPHHVYASLANVVYGFPAGGDRAEVWVHRVLSETEARGVKLDLRVFVEAVSRAMDRYGSH